MVDKGAALPQDSAVSDGFTEDKGKGKAAERIHDSTAMSEDVDDDDDDDDDDEESDDEDLEGENEGDADEGEDGADEIDLDNIVAGGRRTRGAKIDFAKAAAENPADEDDDEEDDDFEPSANDTEMSG